MTTPSLTLNDGNAIPTVGFGTYPLRGDDGYAALRSALDNGYREVEVTKEAEDAWLELLLTGPGLAFGSPDCTPGYYNNEGQPAGPGASLFVGYPGGAMAYFQYLDGWRSTGDFEGLEFL